MPRRQIPCSVCGTLRYSGNGCLPPGQMTCQSCRRERNPNRKAAPTTGVGTEAICKTCGETFTRRGPQQRYCWNPCQHPGGGPSPQLGSTEERGYGSAHKRARDEAIDQWQDGDPCARCDGPMYHGEPVDLDHNDDRTGYLGLSHRSCNRSRTGRMNTIRRDAVCDHCGATYRTRWESQRYCSVPCRKASATKPVHTWATGEQVGLNLCAECGGLTTKPRYCSNDCYVEGMRRSSRTRKRLATGRPVDAPVRSWQRRV